MKNFIYYFSGLGEKFYTGILNAGSLPGCMMIDPGK